MSGSAAGRAYAPGAHLIEAYGAGGFGFAGLSHIGSILATPKGVGECDVTDPAGLTPAAFQPIFDELAAEPGKIEFVVIGTGSRLARLRRDAAEALRANGLRFEAMGTGAALRMYNIMMAEGRRVAALLIAAP